MHLFIWYRKRKHKLTYIGLLIANKEMQDREMQNTEIEVRTVLNDKHIKPINLKSMSVKNTKAEEAWSDA